MRPQYAATVRRHFPDFRYAKCYGERGVIKYWLTHGVDDSSPAWNAMIRDLKKIGIRSASLWDSLELVKA